MIDKADTYQLIESAQKGDEAAREQLVVENTGLVNMAAKKFISSGHEFEDLMQLGYIGLIKAIDRFNPEYGVMFSTYAVPMIIGEIRRFLRDDGKVKVSRQVKQNVKLMKQFEENFIQENGRSPRVSELAALMECSCEEIAELVDAKSILGGLASIDDEKFSAGGMNIASDENETKKAEIIDLKNMIGDLKDRERRVIVLRYFEDMTQQQTGELLGISQVQVSRIEKRVLDNMRKSLW